jgi:iron complex outermembrane receptor protein
MGRANTLSAGAEASWVRFEHVNNSPYGGSQLVPFDNPPLGKFVNLAGTFPRFRSYSNELSGFAEDRLVVTPRLSLVGGVRVDRYDADREDLVTATRSSTDFNPASWRAGAVYLLRQELSRS